MSMVNTEVNDLKKDDNLLNNGAVDSDIKSDSNLLNTAADTEAIVDNTIKTEVTSVALEEQKTGQKIEVPTAEELYTRATMSYIRNIKHLQDIIRLKDGKMSISRKGMNRLMTAILQLPMDGMPVGLQGDGERTAFALGQRIIADRYIITHHHIVQERNRLQKEAEQAKLNESNNEVQPQEGEKNEQV